MSKHMPDPDEYGDAVAEAIRRGGGDQREADRQRRVARVDATEAARRDAGRRRLN